MSLLRPDMLVQSPALITAEMLEKAGVKALLLDLDGTLTESRSRVLSPEMLAWARAMREAGIKLFILSNNKSEARVRDFAAMLDAPYAHLSRKPSRRGYFAAARALGLDVSQTAMVGDQVFTDTLGANRAGARSILVEPMCDKWYHYLRRFAEIPFRKEKIK